MTEATGMTATAASGRGRTTENPPLGTQDDSAGGKYCVGRIGKEESAANSAEWSREETEEEASEEESETRGGAGEAVRPLMATVRELEDSGE